MTHLQTLDIKCWALFFGKKTQTNKKQQQKTNKQKNDKQKKKKQKKKKHNKTNRMSFAAVITGVSLVITGVSLGTNRWILSTEIMWLNMQTDPIPLPAKVIYGTMSIFHWHSFILICLGHFHCWKECLFWTVENMLDISKVPLGTTEHLHPYGKEIVKEKTACHKKKYLI